MTPYEYNLLETAYENEKKAKCSHPQWGGFMAEGPDDTLMEKCTTCGFVRKFKPKNTCTHQKSGGGLATICHQMMDGSIWEKCMRCAKTWTKGTGPSSEVYMSQQSVWDENGKTGGSGFYVRVHGSGPWVFQSWRSVAVALRPKTRVDAIKLLEKWTKDIGSLYAMVQCSQCHKFHPTGGTDDWVGHLCNECTTQENPKMNLVKQIDGNLIKQLSVAKQGKGEVTKLPKVNSPMWTDQYSVVGSAKQPYIVSHKTNGTNGSTTDDGWACSCMAFTRNTPREDCKHILKVKLSEGMSTAAKTIAVAQSKEYAEFLKLKAKQNRAAAVDGEVKMVGDSTGRKFR